jgi:hypothetical protein
MKRAAQCDLKAQNVSLAFKKNLYILPLEAGAFLRYRTLILKQGDVDDEDDFCPKYRR